MLTVWGINLLVIAVVVMIHYEFMYRFTILMPKMKVRHRFRIVLGVCAALTAHAVEVWIFALSFYFMHYSEGYFGHLQGNFEGTLLDCGIDAKGLEVELATV